jgi:hypothetical protein
MKQEPAPVVDVAELEKRVRYLEHVLETLLLAAHQTSRYVESKLSPRGRS